MKIIFSNKKNLFLIFLLVSLILTFPIVIGSGVIFKYDWSWPIFDMKIFWDSLIGNSSFGLLSAISKNGPLILGLFGLIHFSPSIIFRLFIILIHVIAGYGFFVLVRNKVKSNFIAFISGLVYSFTPYVFIRTIIGFMFSLIAYAVLPIFLHLYINKKVKNIWTYFLLGFLLSLIFSQIQAGLLISLVLFVNLIISVFYKQFRERLKNISLVYLFFIIVNLPWIILSLLYNNNSEIVSGGAATTLKIIEALPHSLRNVLMVSDHHITKDFFYALAREPLFVLGFLIVFFIAFCELFNKKNRELVLSFFISSLIILPFSIGPTGIFKGFYTWFFNHIPQIAVFRETYHFEFLLAITLVLMFAFGLDFIWQKISQLRSKVSNGQIVKIGIKTLFAGSALFIVAPYLTFDYAGYLKMQKIPSEYYELRNYFQENNDVCKKIYYPPGLGFIYFVGDKTPSASNSDTLANSLNIPYLTDGASVLNFPSKEMFYRNEVVSQFYEKEDSGEFVGLLTEGEIDCVILRLDTETKYYQASNLWWEKDPKIVKKWNNIDLKTLVESKRGMVLEKQFGENIYVYKINPSFQDTGHRIQDNIEIFPKTQDSRPVTYLPLTDWAREFAYYKDGWSRGRYDFWRKHLFTQLRQDFIYTNKANSILTGKVDKKGNYEVWVRYLTGGTPGEVELRIQNYELRIQKKQGEEKFVWKNLEEIEIDNGKIEIKNISGENAIADIVLIEK